MLHQTISSLFGSKRIESWLTFVEIERHSSAIPGDDVVQTFHHAIGVIGSHGRIDGKRNCSIEALFGIRELPDAISEFVLVERVQVERNEVH
jgi:hypothetical protein